MKLKKTDILAIPHKEALGFNEAPKLIFTGVSTDSRVIKPGEIFIAIRGSKYDGHNFISKAIESGASAIIVEERWVNANKPMMVSINLPRLVVENTIEAYGLLARNHRRKFKIPVIAVAGSNGKTTTKEMIQTILSTKYNALYTVGNLNNHIGVPHTLLQLQKTHEIAVIELGTNHPGEIKYLCSISEPTHGLITNIGKEHLEFFDCIDGVAKAECELFDWLKEHNGFAFINVDDEYLSQFSNRIKKSIGFGFKSRKASIRGKILSINEEGHCLLSIKPKGKKAFKTEINIPGEHNAKNALAAITVGLKFNVSPANIQKAFSNIQPANKRMQIQKINGLTIINDTYNSNPDSTVAALNTLRLVKSDGKKIAVLADMLELGSQAEKLHQEIGNIIKTYKVDILLTYGALSKITNDSASVPFKLHFDNKTSLTEYLVRTISNGDVILVKGSRGMQMEDVANALIEKFSTNIKS